MYRPSLRIIALSLLPLVLIACNDEEKSAPSPEPTAQAAATKAAALPAEPVAPDQASTAPPVQPVLSGEERAAVREARQAAREERRLQREQWWTHDALADLQLTPDQITVFESNQAALKERGAQTNQKLGELRSGLQAAVQGGDIPSLRSALEQIRALEGELLQEQLNAAETTLQHLDTDQVAWLQENPRAMHKILRPVLATALSGNGGRGGIADFDKGERRAKRMRNGPDGQN